MNRRAGIIFLKVDGEQLDAKGSFTYGFGTAKREAIIGADGVHGFKETPTVAFIEGEITDRSDLDVKRVMELDNVTATLELANGKVFVVRNGWYAADPQGQTEEANIGFRIEGPEGEEIQ